MSAREDYDRAADHVRRPLTLDRRDDAELIRAATLAASSHNTQPWTFDSSSDRITLRPDLSRRCPVVDPDDAHLYKSLGCAAENLVQAASAQGLDPRVEFEPSGPAVIVVLGSSSSDALGDPPPLAEAITTRQCTRGMYDDEPLEAGELDLLRSAGTLDEVRCLLVERDRIDRVVDDVTRGNLIQLGDPAFRHELVSWIRFSPRAALHSGDGLAGRTTEQPSVPTVIGTALQRLLISAKTQTRQDEERLRSSAGVAAFVTAGDDPPAWVAAGRAYQRFALQAEAIDVRTAMVNQPIEVAALRPGFERWLGLDEREHVQLLVRFGHGKRRPYSLRRPEQEVRVPATDPTVS